jgi:hypothetical protein
MRVLMFRFRRQAHVSDASPGSAANRLPELSARLATCRRKLGDRLFAAHDAQARKNGWQIIPTNGGLGRCYRDPRFDSLATCPACPDASDQEDPPCQLCSGSGRVVLRQAREERQGS